MRTQKSFPLFALLALAGSLFQAFAACDMEFINPLPPDAAASAADGGNTGTLPGGIAALPPEEIAALTPEQIAALTPEQIEAILEEQKKNAEAFAEMEKNGRYLMLLHLPSTAEASLISGVKITDGSSQVARPDPKNPVLIDYSEVSFRSACVPLVSRDGGDFARTGSFYVELEVRIDALTRILIRPEHNALVYFSNGRGSLDIAALAAQSGDVIVPVENPDPQAAAEAAAADRQAESIVSSGGYIRFHGLPLNISKNKFSAVSVLDGSAAVARPSDYESIAVRGAGLTAEAFVPLHMAREDRPFTESGSYYVYFSITIDALTRLLVNADNPLLAAFAAGAASIDAAYIPPAPLPPPLVPHHLTITGLPATASPANFSNVFIYNSEGAAAKCADYAAISVTDYGGKRAALIPLVYDNSQNFNGQDFSDSGNFIAAFSFVSDAFENIIATPRNNCVVYFSSGCAALDVQSIPPVPYKYLSVSGLPANTQELNVSNVFVWNQAGKIAQCEDYALLLFEKTAGATTLKIPLVYTADKTRLFEETGDYHVTFDLNVDALTRILVSEKEKALVSFADGNGSLDAENLPQALPVPYLAIIGLPLNTAKNNFSEVFLYNAAGKIARCGDYLDIIVSKGPDSASALIPLSYDANPSEYFRDSGLFAVSFTINTDINTQIIKTRSDAMPAYFTDGSGQVNLASDYGYFSGGLLNPDDLSPPVIKKGTVFEINGSYAVINKDTAVKPASFSHTSALYVYAVQKIGAVEFEYSATAPAYDPARKAYYSGDARCLYKLVLLKDSADKYAAKTFVNDPWKHFAVYAVDRAGIASTMSGGPYYSLPGSGNPAPQTVSLPEGAYVFVLSGAGGGGSSVQGGQGGYVSELVTVGWQTPLAVFAGQGGNGAASNGNNNPGGGGGGSGSFAFSEADRYLACAGGGGGAGSRYSNNRHSGGGAGGSAGSGGGGSSGARAVTSSTTNDSRYTYWAPTNGGAGGGYLGGAGGATSPRNETYTYTYYGYAANESSGSGESSESWTETRTGTRTAYPQNPGADAGYSLSAANKSGYAGGGNSAYEEVKGSSNGGAAGYAEHEGGGEWKNTNGANGQGGSYNSTAGGAGGNSRNGTRGGGGQAGPAFAKGGDGSVLIYKIF